MFVSFLWSKLRVLDTDGVKQKTCFLFRDKSAWYSSCYFVLGHLYLLHEINAISAVFLLVFTRGLSTSFMENLFANLSLTRS